VENPKQVFHFPTASVPIHESHNTSRGRAIARARAPRRFKPTTSTNSVTFPIEAARPGILIVAEQGTLQIPAQSRIYKEGSVQCGRKIELDFGQRFQT
jgi:hypothetical protein